MKPPATEREQIGTSAIDLFASGMGAFILIALVFMVLFAATPRQQEPTPQPAPVTCPAPLPCPEAPECPVCPAPVICPQAPDCPICPELRDCPVYPTHEPTDCPDPPPCPVVEPLVCPRQPECPACPVCPEPPEPAPEVEPAVDPAPPATQQACPRPEERRSLLPETDLVFVLDTTGSMRGEIESLKRELHIVVQVLERMMPSLGIGMVTFNDRLQRPTTRHHPLRRLTDNESAMRNINRFLRSISTTDARGTNQDLPEAVLNALQVAVNTSFRKDVADRIVIVITDAYAYEDEEGQTLQLARAFARVPGQRISTVHVRDDPDSEKYLEMLAEAGGGEFVPDRGSILANVLMGIL